MERVLSPPVDERGLQILLAAVQSVDLSSLGIHQKGDVVAQADEAAEDGKDAGHCLAVGRSACNKIQGGPWGAGQRVCRCKESRTRSQLGESLQTRCGVEWR